MSAIIDDGGSAYPESASGPYPNGEINEGRPGMTLRDYFAGQAYLPAWHAMNDGYYEGGNKEIAECAYQMADAMIAARKGVPQS